MAKTITLPPKYPIPANWTWVDIGKLVFIKSGYPFDSKRFSNEARGRRPLIRIRDIVKGETQTFTDEECPEEYIIHCGEILIGMDGDFNVAKWKSEEALLNQRVCCIETNSKLLDNDYLFYYLPDPLKKINDATPSVTVKHLSTKTINLAPLPLPPLAEQRRIVEQIESIFAKLDEAKEKAQAVVDGFELRKSAILHKAFTGELTAQWRQEHGHTYKEWEKLKFCELGNLERGRSKHRPRNDPKLFGGKYPFIQTGDVARSGMYVTEHTQTLSEMGMEQSRIFPEGTLCITIAANIGDVSILTYDCCFPDSVVGFTPNEKTSSKYIYYMMSTIQRELEANAPATAQKNINLKILNDLILKVPPLGEQKEIIVLLEHLFEKEEQAKEAAEAVIDQIDTMKKAVLARAFRGELGTNNPAEESAVELLKVIL